MFVVSLSGNNRNETPLFENRILEIIFGPKMESKIGSYRDIL
jgi:hypothetical protein